MCSQLLDARFWKFVTFLTKCPNVRFHISEDEVSVLVNDADKYEVKLDKNACLKVSRQVLKVYDFRAHRRTIERIC